MNNLREIELGFADNRATMHYVGTSSASAWPILTDNSGFYRQAAVDSAVSSERRAELGLVILASGTKGSLEMLKHTFLSGCIRDCVAQPRLPALRQCLTCNVLMLAGIIRPRDDFYQIMK